MGSKSGAAPTELTSYNQIMYMLNLFDVLELFFWLWSTILNGIETEGMTNGSVLARIAVQFFATDVAKFLKHKQKGQVQDITKYWHKI